MTATGLFTFSPNIFVIPIILCNFTAFFGNIEKNFNYINIQQLLGKPQKKTIFFVVRPLRPKPPLEPVVILFFRNFFSSFKKSSFSQWSSNPPPTLLVVRPLKITFLQLPYVFLPLICYMLLKQQFL